MLDKVKEFFESEYNLTKHYIESGKWYVKPKDTVEFAVQRCLGVANFVQLVGVGYNEIDALYDEYKEKLEKLLDK